MTPDTPAMDEKGLAEAYAKYEKLFGIEINKGERIIVRNVIAAYLAATAREDAATVEQVAECIWQAEWKRAGNGGARRVPWSEISPTDQDRYRFVAREVALLKASQEAEVVPKYWREGTAIIEACLAKAVKADTMDAPIPLIGAEAKAWHYAQAEAYRHALEMMGVPSCLATAQPSPEADGDAA